METKMIVAVIGALAILSGVIFAAQGLSTGNAVSTDSAVTTETQNSEPTCGMGGCSGSCSSCGGNCASAGGCLANGGCGCGCGAK